MSNIIPEHLGEEYEMKILQKECAKIKIINVDEKLLSKIVGGDFS